MDAPQAPTEPAAGGAVTGPADGGILHFGGTLVLTSSPLGPAAVPDLDLRVDQLGLHLARADGTPVWHAPWTRIRRLSTAEQAVLPSGGDAVVLAVDVEGDRTHRLVLPSGEPEATVAALAAMAAGHGVPPAVPPRTLPWWLVTAVVVLTAAVVTALLLAAGHLVHY